MRENKMPKNYRKLALFCIVVCLLCSSGCGKSSSSSSGGNLFTTTSTTAQTTISTTEVVTTVGTTTVDTTEMTTIEAVTTTEVTTTAAVVSVETDDSAVAVIQADGSVLLNFYQGACQITLPASWAERIFVQEGTVYHRAVWEDTNGGGELFSIHVTSLEQAANTPFVLIGSYAEGCIFYYLPQDMQCNPDGSALMEEFLSMANECESMLSSAICPTICTPVSMNDFAVPSDSVEDIIYGYWEVMDETLQMQQFTPYLTFAHSGAMTYEYGMIVEEGSYIVNAAQPYLDVNHADVVSAIAYFNGTLHEIKLYASQPMMLEINGMTGIEAEKPEDIWTFTYYPIETWDVDEVD
ncbi:MAG: hypothetical protein Q4D37_02570 [Oscillospiraceae bacterium]|nr:hypothetical protein [Oscillospiraceae bacterium]